MHGKWQEKHEYHYQAAKVDQISGLPKRVKGEIWRHSRLMGDIKAIEKDVSSDENMDSDFRKSLNYSKNWDNGLLM